jgi:tetratricopeptide (TPR) repeat protein
MTPTVLALAFSLIAQAPAAQTAPADPVAQAYFLFMQGRSLENSGKVDEAIAAYREALTLTPKAAEIHAELAGLYARANKATESINEAQAALALDPNDLEAHRILGLVQAALAHQSAAAPGAGPSPLMSQAIANLERVVSPDRRDSLSEFTLGQMYVESGNYAKGIDTLQLFLLDQPGYPDAVMLLAQAYDAVGRPNDAVDMLEEVVQDQPNQVQARVWLGELYEKVGRWKDAAAIWGQLSTRNLRNSNYKLRQATALVNSGDVEGGRALLVDLTKQSPRDISLLYLLSQVERRTGDNAGAESTAKQIAQIDPNDPRGPLALAESQAARGDYPGVIATLKTRVTAATDFDASAGAYIEMAADLAAAMHQTGDHSGAVGVLDAARKRLPDDPDLQFELGSAYDRVSATDQAETIFRGLIAKDPGNAQALNYLGYMLADHNRKLPEAVDLIQRALKIDADNPSYLDSLGWAYFRQDKLADAQPALEHAATSLPRVSVIQDHLGQLYFQLKRYREAASAFDRALTGDREELDVAAVTKRRDRARELAGK